MGEASNKLGQLFVDIGLGGLGNTLKGLNAISANFLLTKKAASEMLKPIKETSKRAMEDAINYEKMAISLGTTTTNIQKLMIYLKQKNLSNALLSDMEKISNMYARYYQTGEGMSDSFIKGLTMFGLNFQKYNASFESMLQLITDIQERAKTMPAELQRINLQDVGLSNDLIYAFSRGDFNLADALTISDAQIKATIDAKEKMNELSASIDTLTKELVTKILPPLGNIADFLNSKLINWVKEPKTFQRDLLDQPFVPNAVKLLNPTGDIKETIPFYKDIIRNIFKGSPLNESPVSISIMNENTFYGGDAEEIAQSIAHISTESIEDARFNNYQSSNRSIS